jgi:hypothetical protein
MAHSPCFFTPLADSPLFPLVSPSTYLAPSSCVRTVLPSLRLLVNWPHLPHPSPNPPPPFQNPRSQLPSTLLWRPREHSGSCYPEQVHCTLKSINWLPDAHFCRFLVVLEYSPTVFSEDKNMKFFANSAFLWFLKIFPYMISYLKSIKYIKQFSLLWLPETRGLWGKSK